MKKLSLLALVTLFICGNASAITPESCKKSTAIIQNKMAKLNSYAPFDVNFANRNQKKSEKTFTFSLYI
jgi:hypothetical protein